MVRHVLFTVLSAVLIAAAASGQTREEKVRDDKKKVEADGKWIYNDVPKAFAEAKRTGKPIVAVLRCLPCEECVKLDDELIDADDRIKPLLEKFVNLRIVSTNGAAGARSRVKAASVFPRAVSVRWAPGCTAVTATPMRTSVRPFTRLPASEAAASRFAWCAGPMARMGYQCWLQALVSPGWR